MPLVSAQYNSMTQDQHPAPEEISTHLSKKIAIRASMLSTPNAGIGRGTFQSLQQQQERKAHEAGRSPLNTPDPDPQPDGNLVSS